MTLNSRMAVGGQVLKRSVEFSRYGKNAWQIAGLTAAESGLATIIQKEGEVLSYQITDPAKLDAKYWKNAATELTVATAIGAGLPFIGTLMSAEGRGNFKALFNSPNTLNPTQVKIVQATPSAKGRELYGSLADSTGGSITSHAGGEMITPSGKNIGIPAQASMTVKQANAWQAKVGAELETMVFAKATLREQAAQAVRMANDIMLAARNAMEDANAAAQLMMTNPIRSFNELLQNLGKEFSGDVLFKKVIAKAKEIVTDIKAAARTVTEAGGCFVAGTLVHTKEGLKPIEQIQVGDWVLSKPESGEGEQAYKRVANTFSFEDKVVRIVDYSVLRNGEWHHDTLTATDNHPFWVTGIDESVYPSGSPKDLRAGWMRADQLFGGLLIELSTGETARVTSSPEDILWKTNRPGLVWEATFRDEIGVYRDLSTGKICRIDTDELTSINHDFNHDETFSARSENLEWQVKWYYTTKVYNFEVEDFHTYYVGKLGAWVHNTNCYETTVEYMKKHGVLPSIDNQAFHTQGQVKAIIAAMEAAGITPKGMILMQENVTTYLAKDSPWVKYQRGVENGLFKTIDDQSYFFARTLIYKNPIAGGENMIRLGDGAASMIIGSQKVLSKTTIDAKGWGNAWSRLRTETNAEKILAQEEKLVNDLVKTSAALKQNSTGIHQNKPFSHAIEFVSPDDLKTATEFIKRVASDPKWTQKFGPDWFSTNIYLSQNKDLGAVKRVLNDELTSFAKAANGQYADQKVSKQSVLIAIEQNQGFLADIKKLFGNAEPAYQLAESLNSTDQVTGDLTQGDALNAVFAQAKAFWLQQGAFASVLNTVTLSIEALPTTALAQTIGNTITLSPDAAGWGWFVDATPAQSEEFAQLGSSQEYAASVGSVAAGKIDLLGVLIHEIGHTLGLGHSDDAHDEMAATVSPGLRRLPDMEMGVFATGIGQTMHAATTVSHAQSPKAAQYVTAVNPRLANGNFISGLSAWESHGRVQFDASAGQHTINLCESTSAQAHLAQAFVVSAQDRFLTFTVSGLNLQTNSIEQNGVFTTAPQDALEVALQNANTGANLLATGTDNLGTSRSDALLNLQLASSSAGATLQERAVSGLRHTDNADGSRTYVLDLSGIAAGTAVNLSFDLIGFGLTASQLGSKVRISDVRLISTPVAVNDAATLAEDGSATITVQANDLNTDTVGFAPRLVASAQHGQVSVNAANGVFGGFVYTPNANFFGTDSFAYQYSNAAGTELSNTATVTLTPVNDVPESLLA
jgi:hypothetical protein